MSCPGICLNSKELRFYFYSLSSTRGFINRCDDLHVCATHFTGNRSLASSQHAICKVVHLCCLLVDPGKVQRTFTRLANPAVITKRTARHLKKSLASFRSKSVPAIVETCGSLARRAIW